MRIILIFCIYCLTIQDVIAHENTERIKKLEVTVEQLSMQLAEKVVENKRLTAAMADALSAERSGAKIVSGCDVEAIQRSVAFASGATAKKNTLFSEIKSNGGNCTKPQLKKIRVLAAAQLYTSDTVPLLDYLLSL